MSLSILALRREWRQLDAPAPDQLPGDWEASFTSPLRRIAPLGLGLIGLPDWYGKRLRVDDGRLKGVNLVRSSSEASGLTEVLPMEIAWGLSLSDQRPAVVVTYVPGSRRPWPWVRDELRLRPDGTMSGMTYVDQPVVRAVGGTPFILTRRA